LIGDHEFETLVNEAASLNFWDVAPDRDWRRGARESGRLESAPGPAALATSGSCWRAGRLAGITACTGGAHHGNSTSARRTSPTGSGQRQQVVILESLHAEFGGVARATISARADVDQRRASPKATARASCKIASSTARSEMAPASALTIADRRSGVPSRGRARSREERDRGAKAEASGAYRSPGVVGSADAAAGPPAAACRRRRGAPSPKARAPQADGRISSRDVFTSSAASARVQMARVILFPSPSVEQEVLLAA